MEFNKIEPSTTFESFRIQLSDGKVLEFDNEKSTSYELVKRLVESRGHKMSEVESIEKRERDKDKPLFSLNSVEEVMYAIDNFNLVNKNDEEQLASDINSAIDNFDITDIKLSATNRFNDYYIPKILVKYHANIDPIEISANGNFVDLRSAAEYEIHKGDFLLINLGVSIKLPQGYWGQVVPRSSLFKNHGLIMTNSFGVIDTSYCGEDDHWMMPVYATRDTSVEFNERICQFRIVKDIPFNIQKVESLSGSNRGGFGSTGRG